MVDPLGAHYIIELWDCKAEPLNDLPLIREVMLSAARRAEATIIDDRFHKFAPQGVSGVVVIAESHLSIHTWPELGYAALDLFTCNLNMPVEECLQSLREAFAAGQMEVKRISRGIRPSRVASAAGAAQLVLAEG